MCNKYILNGLSTKMFRNNRDHLLKIENISKDEFNKNKKDCISAVGHQNLAEQLQIQYNRFNILLEKNDVAYIVQKSTGRKNTIDSNTRTLEFKKLKVLT